MPNRPSAKNVLHPTEKQLQAYSEGRGAEAFRAALERHFAKCPDCAASLSSRGTLQLNRAAENTEQGVPVVTEQAGVPAQLLNHSQYEVMGELGRGGMGIVYLVRHRLTGRKEALSVGHACQLAIQLCEGLEHAHGKGMIHRDVKPANLILQFAGDKPHLKILDFGLAKGVSELNAVILS